MIGLAARYAKSAFYGFLALFGVGVAAKSSDVVDQAKTIGIFVVIGLGAGVLLGAYLKKKGVL